MMLAQAMPANLLRDVIATIVRDEDDAASAEIKALLRNFVFGISEPLRRATSDEELFATIDALAKPSLLEKSIEFLAHPAFGRLIQEAHAASLRPPRFLDRAAEEFADDAAERYLALANHLSASPPCSADSDAVGQLVARFAVDHVGLVSAAYGDVRWPAARPGLLWNDALHSLWKLAGVCGLTWEHATGTLTSARDGRLQAAPFDKAMSDEAARLLGLQ